MFNALKLITALPLMMVITGTILSSFVYIGAAMTGLLILIWLSLSIKRSAQEQIIKCYSLSYWMAAYLIWLIIISTLSPIPNVSLLTMWTLAGLPLAYLAWTIPPSSDLDTLWPHLRNMLWLGGVLLAAWALWQVFDHIGYGQAVGPLVDRNAFAALMNALWFPATYLFLTSKATASFWKPLLAGMGLFVINAALFATTSRGGIATWLLLLPIILWAGYRHTHSKQLVTIIPLIAILAYLFSALFLHTSIAERTYLLAQDPSANARLLMWKSTIQMILAHPISGTGWGTFAAYYPGYRSPLENTTAGEYAHNDYLQLAAEGGVFALLLQLGVMLGILFQLKRSFKQVTNKSGLESVALLLGALALFIHAGINFIFYFAFMDILAGLYLARASQLIDSPTLIKLPTFEKISRPVKKLLIGFTFILLAAPLLIHLTAQLCLTGSQSGLKALKLITPNVNAYSIAKLVAAIRPQEGIAQEAMLQTAEQSLADSEGISMTGGNFQRELLNETLERFDFVRAQTANNPNYGVREAKVLIKYHACLDGDTAYIKAHQILEENLKADPYHANSMIELARLQVAEGHRNDAFHTLQWATHHVLSRRDQQLIDVETLRQLAVPKIIPELNDIEKQLRTVRSDSETGKPLILTPHFSEDIDARLHAILVQIQQAH